MSALSEAPTARQLEVLRAIRDRSRSGVVPTIRELCSDIGVSAHYAVVCHLRSLEAKGLVGSEFGKARTLKVTDLGRKFLGEKVKTCRACGSLVSA